MSAGLKVLEPPREAEPELAPEAECYEGAGGSADRPGDEQILILVHDLFFAGALRPVNLVVFSGASEDTGVSEICERVAQTLARQKTGKVALVEAESSGAAGIYKFEGGGIDGGHTPEPAGTVHMSSRQIGHNLWRAERAFWDQEARGLPTLPRMRRQLGALRGEYKYAVIHAPPVARSGATGLLAHLADGLVLVVEAHSTRRILAHRLQENLRKNNVRILGAVLRGRTFPIPERLYQRV